MVQQRLDIGIAGLGMAGSTLAILLRRAGHRVTVYEQAERPAAVGAGIWLQHLGQQVLARIGVLDELRRASSVVSRVHGVTAAGRVVMDFGYADVPGAVPALGVHRGTLFDLLQRRLGDVEVRPGLRISAVRPDDDGAVVFAGARAVGRHDLVVGADGRDSVVRESLGLTRWRRHYRYGAVWAMVDDPDQLAGDRLYQGFAGTRETLGVLPTGTASASIFTSVHDRDRHRPHAREVPAWRSWVDKLAGPYGPLLDRVERLIPAGYSDVGVGTGHRVRTTSHGQTAAVLIGDAAHAMSPQLGAGTSLALADAHSLAHAVEQADDLRAALHLHRRRRHHHVRFHQWVTRLMTPVFASDLDPIAVPRDLLLPPISAVPIVRTTMINLLTADLTSPWSRYRLPDDRPGSASPTPTRPTVAETRSLRSKSSRVNQPGERPGTKEKVTTMAVYTLPDLPYDYSALAPHIAPEIMELHHSKHHNTYVTGANTALEKMEEARAAGDFGTINKLEKDLAFNLGGHVNHSVFWKNMSPDGGGEPTGEIAAAIDEFFGSFAGFKGQFAANAAGIQGSGWSVLAWDSLGGRLNMFQLFDQQANVPLGQVPVLQLDMWEHAFYLQYKNVKADYVDAWWNVVNWADASARLAAARSTTLG